MQRLSGLSRRYLRERRGRALLAGTGIALGVTVLFSSLITITSFNRGLRGMQFTSPGMDVVVMPSAGGPDATVDDAVIDRLAAAEGVDRGLRTFGVALTVATERDPDTTHTMGGQFLFGIDAAEVAPFAAEDPLYDLTPTSGRPYADGADEVMLSERHAEFYGVTPGDYFLATNLPGGPHRLLVTGLLSDESLARRNTGRLVFTSLATARRIGGQPGAVSWAALHLEDGTTTATWIAEHGHDARLVFHTAESTIADDRATIAELGDVLTLFSSFILFVAGFLIFLTLSMAVAERQATLGILRALGASRADLFRLVVVEAAVLGSVATAVGLLAGYGLAYVNLVHEPLGKVPYPHRDVPITVGALAAAVGLGVVITVLAAVVPAWRAARMAPLDAIREPVGLRGGSPQLSLLGVVLFPAGLLVTDARPDDPLWVGVGLFTALGGAMLVVPAVLPWLCRRLMVLGVARPLRLVHVVLPHLSRERTRSAYTLGLAMSVMAMATAMGAAAASAQHTGEMQVAAGLADVVTVSDGVLEQDLLQQIDDVPGVGAATPTWWGRTRLPDADNLEMLVLAIDPTTFFEVGGFAWASGDEESFVRRLARPGAVALPESLARQLAVSVGDEVVVMTNHGPRRFEVGGTYVSIASNRGVDSWASVVVSQEDGRSHFGLDWPARGISAQLEPGADVDTVVEAIKDLQADSSFVVSRPEQLRSGFDNSMRAVRNLVTSILVPASLVSAVGLANTLAVAVLERRRELGVLRAMGLGRGQARSLALLEAGVLVAVAAVLSVPVGAALSRPVVDATAASFDTVVHYAFPWRWLLVAAGLALVLAVVAAIAPARRAARIDVGAALRFE